MCFHHVYSGGGGGGEQTFLIPVCLKKESILSGVASMCLWCLVTLKTK